MPIKAILSLFTIIISYFVFTNNIFAASPIGSVDKIFCGQISGWAKDPDNPNAQLKIHLYSDRLKDGQGNYTGGFFWGEYTANVNYGSTVGNHGFNILPPSKLRNGKSREYFIYAVDSNNGAPTLLPLASNVNNVKTCPNEFGGTRLPKQPTPAKNLYYIDLLWYQNGYLDNYSGYIYDASYAQVSKMNTSQFNLGQSYKFLGVALQGLVNRKQPQIYVKDSSYFDYSWGPDYFKNDTIERTGGSYTNVPNNNLFWLIKTLQNHSNLNGGFALYDSDIWLNTNKAYMSNFLTAFCGVNNCLPITDTLLGEARQNGVTIPVKYDFRNGTFFTSNGYPYNAEGITNYMITSLTKDVSNSVAANLHPQLFVYNRDYYIANKIMPIFIRDGATNMEEAQIENFLNKQMVYLGNIIGQVGSHNSDWLVPTIDSKYGVSSIKGKYEELENIGISIYKHMSKKALSIDYTHSMNNLSLYSGFKFKGAAQKQLKNQPELRNRHYIALMLSDGENLGWSKQLWPNAFRLTKANYVKPGQETPLNWSTSQLLIDIAPNIVENLYKNMGEYDYIYAVNGYGSIELDVFAQNYGNYLTSTDYAQPLLKDYIGKSCIYADNLDSKVIYMGYSYTKNDQLKKFAQLSSCYDGVFSDYGLFLGQGGGVESATYNNATFKTKNMQNKDIGVFRPLVQFNIGFADQTQAKFLNDFYDSLSTTRPAFYNLWVLGNSILPYAKFPNVQSNEVYLNTFQSTLRDDPNIIPVRADTLVSLFRQYHGLEPKHPDVNNNGETGYNDFNVYAEYIADNSKPNAAKDVSDMDKNGRVDLKDLVYYIKLYQ